MRAPETIHGKRVVQYAAFREPILPVGYVPPKDGQPPLEPVQNVAICTADDIEGFYVLFCTPDWRYVTFDFYETIEHAKRVPLIEFGHDITVWHKRDA